MSCMDRRTMLGSLAVLLGGTLAGGWDVALGASGPRARRRRRVRRRIRRRHRRRVARRVINGRPLWVVPVGLAVGWELVYQDRVLVVQETRIVERDGAEVEIAVVAGEDGKTEEMELLREDNAGNKKELQGSVLRDDDKTTPGVESVEEVEEDE